MIVEMVLHHLKLVCDAMPPAGMHCDVAAAWAAPSRDAVQLLAQDAGWRMQIKAGYPEGAHICPTCMRRYPKLKLAKRP